MFSQIVPIDWSSRIRIHYVLAAVAFTSQSDIHGITGHERPCECHRSDTIFISKRWVDEVVASVIGVIIHRCRVPTTDPPETILNTLLNRPLNPLTFFTCLQTKSVACASWVLYSGLKYCFVNAPNNLHVPDYQIAIRHFHAGHNVYVLLKGKNKHCEQIIAYKVKQDEEKISNRSINM